ncbi:putative ABC transporter; permease protein [Bradyrhizobium sp. ORS 285]|uniref:ABC transporter permease n=1 Tax=Bradyrhizobium sp. ORS 285 TaxID=115808 RepID=UPI0002409F78|nr:ABC transporter permease [Bradyrhizobium sp. ORS 285]CCD84044.1 putative ABC transporter; permease protein [Bradyrhizobium sp. ORS 285]SMX56167.1 putative ABC transporter; permease protein [Bradyrhizobium sp. ORS 285]
MSETLTLRPEIVNAETPLGDVKVEASLSWLERIYRFGAVRKAIILVALAALWQAYGVWLGNPLLFPTFTDTLSAFFENIANGVIPARTLVSLETLLIGYGVGIALAAVLTTIAIGSRIGADLLEALTSMFNPLPAIALLPLALIWFGLGKGSIIFVLVHSVLWAIALNTHSGFRSVSNTLRMVGLNYGLRGLKLVRFILIPAAFPAILTGLKVGWAFAWRTLIAAELVFGVSSGSGGLGWFIFENRNQLETANVFAGLFTVIIIGLVIENVVFATIERRTVRRWGMQH